MAGKLLSTPPASQSPGMAIEKNPYASDQAGGYDMFTGDYEVTKQSIWERLIAAMRVTGERAPSKQEFDQFYDQTEGGSPMPDAGTSPALGEQDWRAWEGAPVSAGKEVAAEAGARSEASWQRMLKALKAQPTQPEEPDTWGGMPLTRGK